MLPCFFARYQQCHCCFRGQLYHFRRCQRHEAPLRRILRHLRRTLRIWFSFLRLRHCHISLRFSFLESLACQHTIYYLIFHKNTTPSLDTILYISHRHWHWHLILTYWWYHWLRHLIIHCQLMPLRLPLPLIACRGIVWCRFRLFTWLRHLAPLDTLHIRHTIGHAFHFSMLHFISFNINDYLHYALPGCRYAEFTIRHFFFFATAISHVAFRRDEISSIIYHRRCLRRYHHIAFMRRHTLYFNSLRAFFVTLYFFTPPRISLEIDYRFLTHTLLHRADTFWLFSDIRRQHHFIHCFWLL